MSRVCRYKRYISRVLYPPLLFHGDTLPVFDLLAGGESAGPY